MNNNKISTLVKVVDEEGSLENVSIPDTGYLIIIPLREVGFGVILATDGTHKGLCSFLPSDFFEAKDYEDMPIYTPGGVVFAVLKFPGLMTTESLFILIEVLINRRIEEITNTVAEPTAGWRYFELHMEGE